MDQKKKVSAVDIILATLVMLIVAFPICVLFFFLVMQLFPAEDNGHSTMPLPQASGSIVLTLACCIFLFRKVLDVITKNVKSNKNT